MLRPSKTKNKTVSKNGIVLGVDRSIRTIILLMATLLFFMFITYFWMTRHTENTYQIDLPNHQLSTLFLSDLHKMQQALSAFPHDAQLNLEAFNTTKKNLDDTLSSLLLLNQGKNTDLDKIDLYYQQYIQQINVQIIDRFSAGNKTEAINELKLINKHEYPALEMALSRLLMNNNNNISALSSKDRRHYILLLKEISQQINLYLNYYLVTDKNIDSNFSELENRFTNYLNLLTINARDDKDKINLDIIKQNFNKLVERFSSIEIAHSPDSNIALNTALNHIKENYFLPLKNNINTFIQTSHTHNQAKVNQLQYIHHFAPYIFLSLFCVLIFITYWMKRNISRRFIQPIAVLGNQINQLADGNTNIAPMRTTYIKELDSMAQALEQFKAHLFSKEQDHEQMIYQKEQMDLSRVRHAQHLTTSTQEIHVPLNGLIGTLTSLQQTPLSPSQRSLTNSAKQTATSISHLVNDITDFAYHDTEKMKLNNRPLDLRQLAENVLENLYPVAMEKNVSLSLYMPPNFDSALVGDQLRIQQLLSNLVNNAINFSGNRSQKGQVSINIQNNADENQQAQIHLMVRDNGIGMPSVQSEDIFAPFTQGKNAKKHNIDGIGMGLTLCKNIATLMQGKIQVTSSKNKGATFDVFFHLQKNNAKQQSSEKQFQALAAPLREKQCLIVLQASPLKTVLTQYLKALSIPHLSYSLTQIEDIPRDQEQSALIITNEVKVMSSPSLKNHAGIKILQLTERTLSEETETNGTKYVLSCAPLKLSELLQTLRHIMEIESLEPTLLPLNKHDDEEKGESGDGNAKHDETLSLLNTGLTSQEISFTSFDPNKKEEVAEKWLLPDADAMIVKGNAHKTAPREDKKLPTQQSEHLDLNVINTLFLDNKSLYLSSLKQFHQFCSDELPSFSLLPSSENMQLIKQKARRYKTASRSIGAYGISERCHTIEMDIIKEKDTLEDNISLLHQEVERSLPIISSVIQDIEEELNTLNK